VGHTREQGLFFLLLQKKKKKKKLVTYSKPTLLSGMGRMIRSASGDGIDPGNDMARAPRAVPIPKASPKPKPAPFPKSSDYPQASSFPQPSLSPKFRETRSLTINRNFGISLGFA